MSSSSPKPVIVYVSQKTQTEIRESGELKCFFSKRYSVVHKGDILVYVNRDTRTFVAVAVVDGDVVPRLLLDPDVFTGDDQRYQKFEVPLTCRRWFARPISIDDVARMCGIPTESKVMSNIRTLTPIECAKRFYNGEGKKEIESAFDKLVFTWV